MALLWLFDTCGAIIAPLMWLTGLVAIGLCIRAMRRPESAQPPRIAMKASLLPLAFGLLGAIVGLMFFQDPRTTLVEASLNMAKVCLAGLVVTAVPFVWSLSLMRSRQRMA